MFLDRIRRLLSLVSSPSSLRAYLESSAPAELPPGCSIDLELELKELLQTFLPRGALEVERVYRELVLGRGERPTIGELYRMGYNPRTLRTAHDSWFQFVATEGDLDADETKAFDIVSKWLTELETSATLKPLELVVLESLLDADALTTGLPLDELAQRSRAFIQRSPELLRELDDVAPLGDPRASSDADWRTFWLKHPVAAWTRGHGWFALEADRFVPRRLAIPDGLAAAVTRMTRELVDYRLHLFRARTAPDAA